MVRPPADRPVTPLAPARRRARLAPLLAALVALPGAAWAVQPAAEDDPQFTGIIVATTWEVRRQASELLADLHDRRGRTHQLLDRVRQLLAEHAEKPIPTLEGWVPLGEVFAAALAESGLAEAFQDHYATTAALELDRLLAGAFDPAAVAALARRYPLTAAADRAWTLLADHAWDRGHLGAYLHYASYAEAKRPETPRHQRFLAAQGLLERERELELPASLDAMAKMWSIDGLPGTVLPEAEDPRRVNQRQQINGRASTFAFSRMAADTIAVSDGRSLVCIDPLFGDRLGPIHELSAQPLAGPHNRPVADDHGFVAVSMVPRGRPLVYAIDFEGRRRWRSDVAVTDGLAVSPPLPVDDLVVIAVTRPSDGGNELWTVALDAGDGSERWRTLIAKDQRAGNRHWRMHQDETTTGPSLALHNGAIYLCSHNGLLARVSTTGSLQRAWNYGSAEGVAPHLRSYAHSRLGGLFSDGEHLVVAPADAGKLLIFGREASEPLRYTGTASSDELLDFRDGQVLLAGSTTTLLDLTGAEPQLQWRTRLHNTGQPRWGRIGEDRVIVLNDANDESMILHLLDRHQEQVLGSRMVPAHTGIGIAGDQMVLAHPDPATNFQGRIIVGYGDERGFQRLQAQAAAEPDNPRPLIGLASLYRAREQFAEAYDHLVRALELEQRETVVDAAARFARRMCDLALGTESFPTAVARIERLADFRPSMAGEAAWWRARQARRRDAPARALAELTAIDRSQSHLVDFEDGLAVDLLTLVDLARRELDAGPVLDHLQTPSPAASTLAPEGASGLRDADFLLPPVVAGGLAIGYSGGQLRAYSATDGSEVWKRPIPPGELPFLGVEHVTEDGPGIEIAVIPGSAAAGAGLETGDRIVAFDGHQIEYFQRDLVGAIRNVQAGAPFTCVVLRADPTAATGTRRLELSGEIGTRLVHPVAANERFAVVTRFQLTRSDADPIQPDTSNDPHAEILDVATGRILWSQRRTVSWRNDDDPHPVPRLLDEERVLIGSGSDLMVLDPTRPEQPLWSIPRAVDTVEVAVLPGGCLAVARAQGTRIDIHHPEDGRVIAQLPATPQGSLILDDGHAVGRLSTGQLACWDLSSGRRLWTRPERETRAVAINGDAVFGIDEQGRLLIIDLPSGETRRIFSQWAAVNDYAIADDRLFIYAGTREGTSVIAAIGLEGGSLLWQTPLPDQLELKGAPVPVDDGVACVLGGRDLSPGVLVLDGEGEAIAVRQISSRAELVPTSAGVLISGPAGITVLERGLPPPGAPLPAVVVDADGDLADIAQEAVNRSRWNSVGESAYLIARSGPNLLVVMEVQESSDGLIIHIGDGGGNGESPAIRLSLRHRHSPVPEGDYSSWKVTGVRRVGPGDDSWRVVVRLSPTPDRAPGTVRVRAEADDEVDGPLAPWWRRQSWRPLTTPEAPMHEGPPGP